MDINGMISQHKDKVIVTGLALNLINLLGFLPKDIIGSWTNSVYIGVTIFALYLYWINYFNKNYGNIPSKPQRTVSTRNLGHRSGSTYGNNSPIKFRNDENKIMEAFNKD